MSDVQQLAAMLERTGLPSSEALEIAREIAQKESAVRPGVSFGGVHGDLVPALWQRARSGGAQSLTVKLEIEPDGYHTSITVLERTERVVDGDG